MKRMTPYLWDKNAASHQPRMMMQKVVCPECRGEMVCVGKKFTPPPRRDSHQWTKLKWMLESGWKGYSWPTNSEMTLRQVQKTFAASAYAERKAAAKAKHDVALLEQQRAAKHKMSRSKSAQRRHKIEMKKQEKYQLAVLEAVARENRAR